MRRNHRIPMRIPAALHLAGGRTMACETENFSEGGINVVLPETTNIEVFNAIFKSLKGNLLN